MNPADPASVPTSKPRAAWWPYVFVSLFWVLMGLLFASQLWLTNDMGWPRAFGRAASDWGPWVVLSPAIFWLAQRFPIGRGRILLPVLLNIVMCVASVYVAEKFFQFIRPAFTGEPDPEAAVAGPPGWQAPAERRGPPQDYPGWSDGAPPPGRGPGLARGGRGGPGPAGRLGPQGPGPAMGPWQHVMHFHLPMSLFLIMASNAWVYFQRMRERERKANELARSLAEARLSALQMQLHPHFLFNALNATTALIRKDPAAAEEMIANLSELLRLALSVRDRHEVTVRQELDYLECYLAIEHVRFGDRLQVHWDVDDAAKDGRVPVLLLQPIVENAIRHGIERRNVDIGQVWITATRSDDRLHFSVRDNGPGPKSTTAPARRGHGVGLDNTRARLAALHGTAAEVQIATGAGGGCVVTIEMPFLSSLQPNRHENQSAHR